VHLYFVCASYTIFVLITANLNTSSIPAVSNNNQLTLYDMSSDAESPPGYFLNGVIILMSFPSRRCTARQFENGFNTTAVTPCDNMLHHISNSNWKRQVWTHNKHRF